MIDRLDPQHGELMRQAVIAQVVAKGTLELASVRVDRAGDREVGLGRHGQAALRRDHQDAPAPQRPANASSGRPSGKGMTAATVRAGGPPTKTLARNGSPLRMAAA